MIADRPLRKLAFLAVLGLALLACSSAGSGPGPAGELANPGFDLAAAEGVPSGWMLDAAAKPKGTLAVLDGYAGASGRALELRPNARNGGDKPLGVGQLLDASRWRGRALQVQVRLGAAGGAAATVGVHALGQRGDLGHVQITQDDTGGALRDQQRILQVPAEARHLIVYAIAGGTAGRAVFDAIRLGEAAQAPAAAVPAGRAAGALRAEVVVDVRQAVRDIPATLYGTNAEWIFNGQGLWRGNGLDPEGMRLGRELGPSVIRFPGGVFSDTYHWRDGTGPLAQRKSTVHYAGGPKSQHVFGSQEVAEYARAVGAELMFTVNAGNGTAEEAADWVRYAREQLRPRVRFWEVGNELYMKGDLSGAAMGADQYAQRYLAFARAMRAADPSIRIGAIGGLNYGNYRFIADNAWTAKVLRAAAPEIDFLAIHNAYAPVVMGAPDASEPRAVYQAMLAAPQQVEANLRDVSALLARHETPQRPISIAVTEWGPFFHVLPASPWVDHVKTMGSALFVAGALNAMLRTPRVEMANFFKLADQGFMGWLGRRQGGWIHTAPGMAFSLYRNTLGRRLVQAQVRAPTFSTPGLGVVSAATGVPLLDAVATYDNGRLRLILLNRSDRDALEVAVRLPGVAALGAGRAQTLSADSLDAHTGSELPQVPGLRWAPQVELARFRHGAPGEIRRTESGVDPPRQGDGGDAVLTFSVPALSLHALRFENVELQAARR